MSTTSIVLLTSGDLTPRQQTFIQAIDEHLKREPWYKGLRAQGIPSDDELRRRGVPVVAEQVVDELRRFALRAGVADAPAPAPVSRPKGPKP